MDAQDSVMALGGIGGDTMEAMGFFPLFGMMLCSLLCSLFLVFLYNRFYQPRATGSSVHRSFPLLGPAITAIFITIQFSLPLSLGLLGALSIIRFRTPIKEPEEIGFIIMVVATALCCATFNLLFLGIILLIAVGGLMILHTDKGIFKRRMNDGMLMITLPSREYGSKKAQVMAYLERVLPQGRLDSITEAQEETVISYGFIEMDKATLLTTDSVKEISEEAQVNVFFNRSGEV